MTVSPVSASTTASTTAASSSGSGSSSASSLTQSDFLQLLTAQLQYQTPNSPADPTQMASEFAQISTVDGIDKLNTQVSDLQTTAAASQMGQAGDLVGKQVAVSGDSLTVNPAGTAVGAFNLGSAAQDVTVSVLNSSGAVAGTVDLGAMQAGQQSFSWGSGTAGTQYTYQVDAVDASGAPVSVTPYSVYTVEGVNVSGTTPTLNVQGSATPLAVSSVQTVLGASS
jgi:flagellar basal-body rod modification protein FlgD